MKLDDVITEGRHDRLPCQLCGSEEDRVSNTPNLIKVTLSIKGKTVSAYAPLDELSLKAQGPMSLESSCMSLVREISQELYRRMTNGRNGS